MADILKYCSLHQHSEYSFLDSCNQIDQLAEKAKSLGMPAMAITDHGSMHGVVKFYYACKNVGVKPIIGMEAYMTYSHDLKERKSRHLTILAENNIGLENLYKLVTISNTPVDQGGGFFYRPRIDFKDLEKHAEGLIILSGCMNSVINHEFGRNNDYQKGEDYAKQFLDIFGKDNFFVEMQLVNDPLDQPGRRIYIPEQDAIWTYSRKLAKNLGLKTVATNDGHYLNEEDAFTHEILKCIDAKGTLATPVVDQSKGITRGRLVFNGFDYNVKSTDDMLTKFTPTDIKTTEEIAERCNVTFESEMKMPLFEDGIAPDEAYQKMLKELRKGWVFRNINSLANKDEYEERIKIELADIEGANLANYFLIVWDVLRFCRDSSIPIGPGRGSAAGSLVSYLLQITQIDPVKHGLFWERFWNRGRKGSMPDIDVDVSIRHKDRVVSYIKSKFGEDRVFPMMTIGKMESKQALKDVGKSMGLPHAYLNELTKLIPVVHGKNKSIKESIEEVNELKEISEGIDADVKIWQNEMKRLDPKDTVAILSYSKKIADRKNILVRTFEVAKKLEGCARNRSVHACALLIADRPVAGLVPLAWDNKKKQHITGFDMYDIEKLGFLKLDILGLKTLDVIADSHPDGAQCLYNPEKYFGPWDDAAVYDLFAKGRTKGIFQLESPLGRTWCKKMKPKTQGELSDLVALIRPAVLEIGMAEDYLKNRKKPDDIPYIHKDLEPILSTTYGCQLYQEQMLAMVRRFAGFDLAQADAVRKAVGKKLRDKMAALKDDFIEGVKRVEGNDSLADELWGWVEQGAEYSFNKCVSGETTVYRGSANKHGESGVTIAHLYKTKNDLKYAKKMECIPLRKKLQTKRGYGNILSLDGDGRIRPRPIKDIIYTGRKQTFNIICSDGTVVRTTEDHKFFTEDGFVRVGDMIVNKTRLVCDSGYEQIDFKKPNRFSDYSNEWKSRPYSEPKKGFGSGLDNPAYTNGSFTEFKESKLALFDINYCQRCLKTNCRLEHNHINSDRIDSSLENIEKLCSSCHKKADYAIGKRTKRWQKGHATLYVTVIAIEEYGIEDTYDIEMDTAEHNYIAEGLVSSNSHSMCYGGVLGYITAYLKVHHPARFILSLLKFSQTEQDSHQEVMELYYDAKLFGIGINPPNTARGNIDFELEGNQIYFGLSHIKHIGASTIKNLENLGNSPWSCVLLDRENKHLKRDVFLALILSGAFDHYGVSRPCMKSQFEFVEQLTKKELLAFKLFMDGGVLEKTTKKSGIMTYVTGTGTITFEEAVENFKTFLKTQNESMKIVNSNRAVLIISSCIEFLRDYKPARDFGPVEKAGFEAYYLGVPLTCSETDMYDRDYRKTHHLVEVEREFDTVGCCIIVLINKINERTDKNGREMAFIGMQDSTYQMDAAVFSNAWLEYREKLELGKVVLIEGKKSRGGFQVIKVEELV